MSQKREDGTDTLASRLKGYEVTYETNIEYDKFIVVRLDGHKFSKYTKKYNKPFDSFLSAAMEFATKELVERFGAVTGYTQSDEITLIFPPQWQMNGDDVHNNQVFRGRLQKIVSLFASYCSVKFNNYMIDALSGFTYDEQVNRKVGEAYFDARIYGVPTAEEAFNSVMWRVRDALKNSYSMYAQAYVPHKQLLNLNSYEQIQLCKDITGNDWNTVDDRYKYGVLIKKELYQKVSSGVEVTRSRYVSWSEKLTSFSPEGVKMVNSKYKPEV